MHQLHGSTIGTLTQNQAVGGLGLMEILQKEGGHRMLADIKMGSDFGGATDQTCHLDAPEDCIGASDQTTPSKRRSHQLSAVQDNEPVTDAKNAVPAVGSLSGGAQGADSLALSVNGPIVVSTKTTHSLRKRRE
jgi:hypothetical protein